jgi:hypothetical protein
MNWFMPKYGERDHRISIASFPFTIGDELDLDAAPLLRPVDELFRTIVVVWPTTERGHIDRHAVTDGHFEVAVWEFGQSIHHRLRDVHREFPLGQHDLYVQSRKRQDPRVPLELLPTRESMLREIREGSETLWGFIKAQVKEALKYLETNPRPVEVPVLGDAHKAPHPLLSMGCAVEKSQCLPCETMRANFDHAYGSGALGMAGRLVEGKVEFFSASWVPAPKCDECQTSMDPASSTEWACPNTDCGKHGEPIHVGVYPLLSPETP